MNKWMTGALGAVLAVTLLAGCGTTGKDQAAAKEEKKLKVVASFDAMAEFAKAVGKDKIDVVTLIPAGTEQHGFEPSTEVMKELTKADVFIYNGLGMEPADEAWAPAWDAHPSPAAHHRPCQNTYGLFLKTDFADCHHFCISSLPPPFSLVSRLT